MVWDPPGLWASIIISLLGGLAAGALVLAGEVAIRRGIDRRQRRKTAWVSFDCTFTNNRQRVIGSEVRQPPLYAGIMAR